MLSVHMAERKELKEQEGRPEMDLGEKVQGLLYRLQSLREEVLHREDRPQAAAREPPTLLHRRTSSNDTDVAVAADANAPPRRTRSTARLREHRRGNSSDTDRAIGGSASVTEDGSPFVSDFMAASDDALEEAIRASLQEFNAVTSPAASILEQVQHQEDGGNATQEWACVACTFVNTSGRRCAMCRTRRAA